MAAEKKNVTQALIGRLVISIVLTVVATLVSGYVFGRLWAWFLVRHGAPPLSVAEAIGLVYTLRFVDMARTIRAAVKEAAARTAISQEDEDVAESYDNKVSLALIFVVYPAALGIGWLWAQLLP